MSDPDPYDLQRFVTAQAGGVWEAAQAELAAGHKRTHWMWFIFPQARGLGRSALSAAYAVGSLYGARAYLQHPVLGPRLRRAAALVAQSNAASLRDLLGEPDDVKFISSMTLFALAVEGLADAGPQDEVFHEALNRWNAGRLDDRTMGLAG